jgi:hypothetical protein
MFLPSGWPPALLQKRRERINIAEKTYLFNLMINIGLWLLVIVWQ